MYDQQNIKIHGNYQVYLHNVLLNLDIWLTLNHSITLLLLPTWYTNFLFIYTNYNKLNTFTCFERIPPIIRRSTKQIVHQVNFGKRGINTRDIMPSRFYISNTIPRVLLNSVLWIHSKLCGEIFNFVRTNQRQLTYMRLKLNSEKFYAYTVTFHNGI
jgi:hypothetical protein